MVAKIKTSELLCNRGWKSAIRDVAKCKIHIIVISIRDVNEEALAHCDHELSKDLALLLQFIDDLTSIVRHRRWTIWGRTTFY